MSLADIVLALALIGVAVLVGFVGEHLAQKGIHHD